MTTNSSSGRLSPLDALKLGAQHTRQGVAPSRIINSKPQQPVAFIGHQLKHSSFMAALAGAVAGALVAVAVGTAVAALTVGTGGLAGVLVIGLVGAGIGFSGVQESISSTVSNFINGCVPADDGPIASMAKKTFVENMLVSRVSDTVACSKHSAPGTIAEGSTNVFIENLPVARMGDKVSCGAPIGQGAAKTYFGGGKTQYSPVAEEFSAWQKALLIGIEFIVPPSGGLLRGGIRALFKPRAVMSALVGAAKSAPRRFATKISNVAKSAGRGVKSARQGIKNAVNALKRKKCNDPIDPITGDVFDQATDISLGNTLPLTVVRTYTTGLPSQNLGPNWVSSFDQRLELEDSATEITWHNGTGQEITFVLPFHCEESSSQLNPGYVLRHKDREFWSIEHTPSGVTHFFRRVGNTALLVREEDRHHNSIRWERDEQGLLHTIIHSDGITLHVDYNDLNRISRVIRGFDSGEGHVLVDYEYNSQGYLILANSLSKGITEYNYNLQGLLAEWRDAAHTWAKYEYDAQARCIYTHCSEGFYQGWFEYQDNLTIVTNSKGHQTEYHYNDLELITKIVNPLGQTVQYDYHQNGHIGCVTDPSGNKTEYDYDEQGNVTSVTDPMGNATQIEYNSNGLVTKVVDPLGNEWTHDYDPKGLLKRSHAPLDQSVDYHYTLHGQLESIGEDQQYHYDASQRLTKISNALGHEQQYVYNEQDQLTQAIDAAGVVSRFAYNQQGKLSHTQNAQGHQTHYQYDVEGNLITNIDAEGNNTLASYGAFDLLKSHTDAKGHTYQYQYDPDSLKLTQVINPQGEVYHYHYDAADNVIATVDYSGIKTNYRYNPSGQCIEKTNALGQKTQYTYDANGNLLEKHSHEGEKTVYEYDALNRLISVESPSSTHEFEYDALGKLLNETHNGETITHLYDGNQQRRRRILSPSVWTPDAQAYQTDYQFDDAGQLTHLKLPNTAAYEITYDARGFTRSRATSDGFQLHQTVDSLGQLTEQRAGHHYQPSFTGGQAAPAVFTDHVQRTLKYDTRQNPIEIQDRYWGDTNFNYDANAQISKAKHPSWQDDFEYGGVQQITAQQTSLNDRDPVTSAVHASAQSSSINDHANQRYGYQHGRINERRKSDRETTLWIYDELGRVQEKTEKRHGFRDRTTQYKWNSDDQLTQVITPTKEVWQYQYDAFGRRITKYNPNTKETTHTLWDGDIIAREVRLTGKEAQKTHTEYWHYQPGSFEPIAKQIQSTHERTDELDYKTFYTVTDHIGSPRELFSADGNLAWRGYYSTWGSVHKEEIAGQFKTDCNLRYAGQYFDKESGLHYNRHRYYDPESSQYMSPDPIGLEGGLTPQSYVSNPNGWIDPLGLTGRKYVIIGEGQDAIEKLAEHLRGINPTDEFRTIANEWSSVVEKSGADKVRRSTALWEELTVKGNGDWIRDRIKEGYSFIDIGKDNAEFRSPYYAIEKEVLSKHKVKYRLISPGTIDAIRSSVNVSGRKASKTLCLTKLR